MKKFAYIFDSTIRIDQADIDAYNIFIQPLYVIIDGKPYRDTIDITAEDFYQKLKDGAEPTTSQPSAGDFVETYEKIKAQGYTDVLVFTISAKLSGTAQAAKSAESLTDGLTVHIFDTGTTSYLAGLCAFDVVKFAETTDDLDAIHAFADDIFGRIDIRFYVDSLEALKRGGRISSFQAAIGSLLQIKPMIRLVDGELDNYSKERTSKKAVKAVMEDMRSVGPFEKVILLHSTDPGIIEALTTAFEAAYPGVEYQLAPLCTVIGVHTGPYVGALAVVTKDKHE
ncbi:DegV family protein [Culicoidibacter larvae]|nr:DegV family protein [Culicoidibacter larvae]